MNYTLEKEQSATFRYRVALYSNAATSSTLNQEDARFDKDYPLNGFLGG